ncbi:HEAT repeat domain-containing protein [Halobacteria archaeon HArc-gm2]|nr:HEAT repeat domain-containing protein [Halobacteria archaeon HArc-gm2]
MSNDTSVPVGDVDPESGELSERDVAQIREALRAEKPTTRQDGTRTCKLVVQEDPSALQPLLDDLVALLEDDSVSVAQQAGTVLLSFATEHPGELTDSVSEIVTLATHEVNAVTLIGAQLLSKVVVEQPATAASEVDRLLPLLREHPGSFEPSDGVDMVDNPDTRQSIVAHEQQEHGMQLQAQGTVANVLVAAAEVEPAAFTDHVDELVALVDHDDPSIAGLAVETLTEVGEAHPDAIAPAYDQFVDALDHDDQRVYVRAVRALGVLGDDRAVEPLRDLADSTDDDDVSELVEDTATFLENQ